MKRLIKIISRIGKLSFIILAVLIFMLACSGGGGGGAEPQSVIKLKTDIIRKANMGDYENYSVTGTFSISGATLSIDGAVKHQVLNSTFAHV